MELFSGGSYPEPTPSSLKSLSQMFREEFQKKRQSFYFLRISIFIFVCDSDLEGVLSNLNYFFKTKQVNIYKRFCGKKYISNLRIHLMITLTSLALQMLKIHLMAMCEKVLGFKFKYF